MDIHKNARLTPKGREDRAPSAERASNARTGSVTSSTTQAQDFNRPIGTTRTAGTSTSSQSGKNPPIEEAAEGSQ